MKTRALLLTLALPSLALAQEHTVQTPAQKGKALRTKIESSSESSTSMTMTINGEERGGGGGDRTTSAKQTIEFDETVLDANDKGIATKVQRTYTKLSGSMTMPGRDGEEMETEIEGALEGKKLFLAQDGDKVVAHENDEDGAALEERLARGLKVRTDVMGLLPEKAVAVGAEYDLSKTLRSAMANLQHPMARAAQGEEGGDAAGGGRGGRGGRGQGGFGGRMGGGMQGNEGLGYLMNEKLTLEANGKLEGVSEGLATISFKAKASGEGNPTELGVGMAGGMGGRGGRGGRGGEQGGQAPAVEGTANVECTVEGKLVVDLAKKCIVSLEIEGEFEMDSETSMTREGRDGESMDIETSMERSGSFNLKVAVSEAKSE